MAKAQKKETKQVKEIEEIEEIKDNETLFLTDEERYRLEFLNQKIEITEQKGITNRQILQNKQLTITNLQLQIQKITVEISTIKQSLANIEEKRKGAKNERNEYAKTLAEKYGVDYKNFGYDDETGEIIIASTQNEINENELKDSENLE